MKHFSFWCVGTFWALLGCADVHPARVAGLMSGGCGLLEETAAVEAFGCPIRVNGFRCPPSHPHLGERNGEFLTCYEHGAPQIVEEPPRPEEPPQNEEECDAIDNDDDGRIDEDADCFAAVHRWYWSNNVDDTDFAWTTADGEPAEMDCANFRCIREERKFQVYKVEVPGTTALYSIYKADETDHRLLTNQETYEAAIRNGWDDLGVIGYVGRDEIFGGAIPLFGYYNGPGTAHFFTTNRDEIGNGFSATEDLGFTALVWPLEGE